MSDLICRKTMMRCQTPGMCAPYGGCRTEVAIPADQVLVPRELLEELLEAAKDGAAHKGEYLSKKCGEPELFAKFDTLLHP